ncbi:MAG: YdiU family protein [Solirubrobacterales bacterium]|nr:YdiU family protein [Solirubrobacterales bacterium]
MSSAASAPRIAFDDLYARELDELCVSWQPATPPAPQLAVLNERLGAELGFDAEALRGPDGVALLTGAAVAAGSNPVAQAYAGHQFGFYAPSLGDGRALLVGELLDARGARWDLHLKGSGATPFARSGDGKAALGPMLRECLVGEAMHALGIPTSRALAVAVTGEAVARETLLPGAVLARVAASHVRVGTFQYAATRGGPELVRRLADHVIARHHPTAAEADNPYLALLDSVLAAQASLIARWMQVGFIHGVMNTDNMTISGETIDYGPCAFMDAFDPDTVFSSIDHGRRYAYGNQPAIAAWNLTRFADTLLPLLDEDYDTAVGLATELVGSFAGRYDARWREGMRAKLGLADTEPDADGLVEDLLTLLRDQRVDFTCALRALSSAVRGTGPGPRSRFDDPAAYDRWAERWQAALAREPGDAIAVADAMDARNPIYIPRNHLLEEALAAASVGDLAAFAELLHIVSDPFVARPGHERYAEPAPDTFGPYQTFCGT